MPAKTKARVALIEDDAPLSNMYRNQLEYDGYAVDTASNGQEGLQLIDRQHPDIILLDLMLPDMDGVELLAALNKTDKHQVKKVIVLTNVNHPGTLQEVQALGVSQLLSKSQLTPKQVSEYVAHQLKR